MSFALSSFKKDIARWRQDYMAILIWVSIPLMLGGLITLLMGSDVRPTGKLLLVDENRILRGLITIRDLDNLDRYPAANLDPKGRLMVGAAVGVFDDERVERLVDAHVDVVVIDTAPSRNAVDFIGQPGRLAKLLRGRAVAWLSNIGQNAGSTTTNKLGRIEKLLVRVIRPAVRDVASLFTELARVRERFL